MDPRSKSCINCGKEHTLTLTERQKLAPYCFDVNSNVILKLYCEVMQRFIRPGASSSYRKTAKDLDSNSAVYTPRPSSSAQPMYREFNQVHQELKKVQINQQPEHEDSFKNGTEFVASDEHEVCLPFLKNRCLFTDCFKVHPNYNTTVLWEYRPMGQKVWRQFEQEENEALESRFCDPEIDRGTYQGKTIRVMYDFTTMKATLYPSASKKVVCNITRAEVKAPRKQAWNYYWQNENNNNYWEKFKRKGNFGLDCDEIDAMFERMKPNEIQEKLFLVSNKEGKVLHLNKTIGNYSFHETDVTGNVQREVKRRPRSEKFVHEDKPTTAKSTVTKITEFTQATNIPTTEIAHKICARCTKPCTKRECPMSGCTKDFLWLYRERGRKRWSKFAEAIGNLIESQFCDPQVTEATFRWNNNEEVMKFGDHQIELVSKPNMEITRVGYNDLLSWAWYWHENGSTTGASPVQLPTIFPQILKKLGVEVKKARPKNWYLFGEKGLGTVTSDIESERIEYGFENFKDEKITFAAGRSIYEINFATFEQKNIKSGKLRKIRRRPKVETKDKFSESDQGKEEVDEKGDSVNKSQPPKDWVSKSRCAFMAIEPDDNPDCELITTFFKESMPEYEIFVTRVENHKIWKNYQLKKKEMTASLGSNALLNEVLLFHGTEKKYKNDIMESNTYKVGPPKGMTYNIGKGIYFTSETAKIFGDESDNTERSQDSRFVTVSLVLVGEFTQGSKFFNRPPLKDNDDGSDEQFDSCVDDPEQPRVVALFDANQTYPLYMVELQPNDDDDE